MGCTEKLENGERCGKPTVTLGSCRDHLPKDLECAHCGVPLNVGIASSEASLEGEMENPPAD